MKMKQSVTKKGFREFKSYDTGSRVVTVKHISTESIQRAVKDETAEGALDPCQDEVLVPNDVSIARSKFIFLHETVHDILKENEIDKLIMGKSGGAEEEILVSGLARGFLRFARLNPELWIEFSKLGD